MTLYDLAFKGATDAVRAVLSTQPAGTVNALSPERGTSLLYTAARFGHTELVKVLVLECNADVSIANAGNLSTPLHGAAFGGHADIVAFLLSHGSAQTKNAYGEVPLDNAKSPADGVGKAQAKRTVAAFSASASASTLCTTPSVVPPVSTLETVLLATPAAPATPTGYQDMTIGQLRELLKAKNLSTVGTKAVLVARLSGGAPSADDQSPLVASHSAPPAASIAASTAASTELSSDEPPLKKPHVEIPCTTEDNSATPSAPSTTSSGATSVFDDLWIAKLAAATYTETEVPLNTQEFWDLEERVNAWNQGRNEDYVSNRLKKKKKPITFVLKRAWKISNPVLEEAFAAKRKEFASTLEELQCRVRVAFHGTREANLPSILKTGLLRFKHPLNPCKTQADDGYFGTNLRGVYVSRYYDYTLKYCNGLNPLDDGDSAKCIMFKCLPGKVYNVAKLNMGMEPTVGYNSHSSPNNLEWYLFDERQLCPEYVIEMKAQIDTRTAADDE